MALSASTIWEVRTAGNDTNGGAFTLGGTGTDYSQQNAKNTVGADISTTDAVAIGTAVITSATANFGTTVVDNVIYMTGGTGSLTAQRYRVLSRASTTSITVDRNVAAGTGITMNIGGALASPGELGASTNFINDNTAYIKNDGTYNIASATANVATGRWNNTTRGRIIGYTTNRFLGNSDSPPILQLSVSVNPIWTGGGAIQLIYNIDFDCNSKSTSAAIGGGVFVRCIIRNCTTGNQPAVFFGCLATGNSGDSFASGSQTYYCEAYANTVTPYKNNTAQRCLAYSNTGASTDGFAPTAGSTTSMINCIAIANGRDGFRLPSNTISMVQNCHAQSNTGFGFLAASTTAWTGMFNCAHYNNTGGSVSGASIVQTGTIAASGDVFTNLAGNVYTLNNTGGAGAALRAAGVVSGPSQFFLRGLTQSFQDVGSAQHAEPAPTGGEASFVF